MSELKDVAMSLIVPMVGFVVWLVRLEGRVNAASDANVRTQKDVDDLRVRHESLDSNLVKQLTEIKVTLAEIRGTLGAIKERE